MTCLTPVLLLPALKPLPFPEAGFPVPELEYPWPMAQEFSTITGTSCEMKSQPSSEFHQARQPRNIVLAPVFW